MPILLSNSQAGPGRTVKQEQEEISRNHVQTFIYPTVLVLCLLLGHRLVCPPVIASGNFYWVLLNVTGQFA